MNDLCVFFCGKYIIVMTLKELKRKWMAKGLRAYLNEEFDAEKYYQSEVRRVKRLNGPIPFENEKIVYPRIDVAWYNAGLFDSLREAITSYCRTKFKLEYRKHQYHHAEYFMKHKEQEYIDRIVEDVIAKTYDAYEEAMETAVANILDKANIGPGRLPEPYKPKSL